MRQVLRSPVQVCGKRKMCFNKVCERVKNILQAIEKFSLTHPYMRCGRELHTTLFYLFYNKREAHVSHDILSLDYLCITKHLVHKYMV